jgi:hypothetical protein
MHLAIASSWSLRPADAPLPPPLGRARLAQDRWADSNAGDWAFTSFGMTSPPVALGSGKFGTPCARMHSA